jgi:hypothetical protein
MSVGSWGDRKIIRGREIGIDALHCDKRSMSFPCCLGSKCVSRERPSPLAVDTVMRVEPAHMLNVYSIAIKLARDRKTLVNSTSYTAFTSLQDDENWLATILPTRMMKSYRTYWPRNQRHAQDIHRPPWMYRIKLWVAKRLSGLWQDFYCESNAQ